VRSGIGAPASTCAPARKRQDDVEDRPAAELCSPPTRGLQQLDDLAHDRKAEAGPLDVLRRLRVDAREYRLEDRLQRIGWDAEPFVANVETKLVALGASSR
jgi:hypothetical protein